MAPVQGVLHMIIYSKQGDVEKVVLDGEEFKILKRMANRVQPLNDQERDMLIDLGNEEDENEFRNING